MDDGPAYTITRSTREPWPDAEVLDVGDALRAVGLVRVADHRSTVVGIGEVHHTWTATVSEWARLIDGPRSVDPAVTSIAVEVFEQALLRRTDGGYGAVRTADVLGVPRSLVEALLDERDFTDHSGWPTVVGLARVRDRVELHLPGAAVRAEASEVALLRRVDPLAELHHLVGGPAPSRARRVLIPRPPALAAALLASTGTGGLDRDLARLAMRLDALALWRSESLLPGWRVDQDATADLTRIRVGRRRCR